MKLILIIFLLTGSCSQTWNSYVKTSYDIITADQITNKELEYILQTIESNNYLLVDLRTPQEFQQGHIDRAISLPYSHIEKISNIEGYQNYTIIFYDQKKVNHRLLKKLIKHFDIKKIYYLYSGFESWNSKISKSNDKNNKYREIYEL